MSNGHTAPSDRLPPHSVEAEQGVLGCILIDPVTSLNDTVTVLKPAAGDRIVLGDSVTITWRIVTPLTQTMIDISIYSRDLKT